LTKLQAELTTLKSKRLDGTILMDLGNWYTIRESFKAQWKTQNKSKIIQENLILKMLHFIFIGITV
jgi:exonuclease SbcC